MSEYLYRKMSTVHVHIGMSHLIITMLFVVGELNFLRQRAKRGPVAGGRRHSRSGFKEALTPCIALFRDTYEI